MATAKNSATRTRVRAALDGGAGVVAKRFLQYEGLARGANDTVDQLADRITEYLDAGKLPPDAVERMVRELHEYGSKRVYLMRADPKALAKFRATPALNPIASMALATVTLRPGQPRINYTYIDADHIRISVSETHERYELDLSNTSDPVTWHEVNRVAVLEASKKTGFVILALDSPGSRHPRGAHDRDFIAYYQEWATTTLGTDLVPLNLAGLLTTIDDPKHKDVVRLVNQWAETDDGVDMHMECGGDLRDAPSFQANRKRLSLRKRGNLEWLASPMPPAGTKPTGLIRSLKTQVYASPAMVHFSAHALAHEMGYIIREVRRLA